MIIKRKTINPYEWHKHFVIMPVLVFEEVKEEAIKYARVYGTDVKVEKVLHEQFAVLCTVERKLVSNMTGTRNWIYRKLNK